MYADRYARPEGIKPGSLTVAIAINAGVVAALMLSTPVFEVTRDRVLETVNIPVDPPPAPIPPETRAKPQQDARATPDRIETTPATGAAASDFVLPPLPPLPPLGGTGSDVVTPPIDPPIAPPVLIGAALDPRYARDLQPPYPPGERRAGREGVAQVRVTIGTDGRVRAAECVRADSEAFCRASVAQALAKWRFRPATLDGVAEEATQVLTVRFELAD